MSRLGLGALLFCAACGRIGFDASGSDARSDGATLARDFPRLGAMSNSISQDYTQESFREVAPKFSFVIVAYYKGWGTSKPMTLEQVIQDVHARSTIGTKVFAYINDFDELPEPLPPGDPRMDLADPLEAHRWWLYPSGTTGTPVRAYGDPDYGVVNVSSLTPPDANGDLYADLVAQDHYDFTVAGDADNAATPSLDGFFVANVPSRQLADGDWDRDGVTDPSPGTAAVRTAIQQGGVRIATKLHALAPNLTLLAGMIAWDAEPGLLDQVYLGGTRGSLISTATAGYENTNGFAAMMIQYRYSLATAAPPKLVLFQHSYWVAGDYQAMRYGLGSCMLDDGYYAIDDGTESLVDHALWFDEFDADLGHATQPPQTAAWQNGVFRRDFERGIVLVNPRGNGAQTVDLGGEFHRLTGTQDPTTNSGATVTSVTLADQDGLLLMR